MGRGPKGLHKPMKLVSMVEVPEGAANCTCKCQGVEVPKGAANCTCKCQVVANVTSWIQMPGGE